LTGRAPVESARLATELAKAPSACADYYISIPPLAGGIPRGGAQLTTIHSLGSHFHAMAEIRLVPWATYAGLNGWYAAGLEVRRLMRVAGYEAGDLWAVNEVGAPSNTGMGVNVLRNVGRARADFGEFVRGLYTGDDGVVSRGLVFAADPLQVTPDVSQYKQELESWYSDAPFWADMAAHVRFWAQETYADASTWGVAGSTLPERSAYLNDYFLHGARLAQRSDGPTAAARAFLATAYTPVANASFRAPRPNLTTGIGFGYTDIGLPGMLAFLSAQTYALRASTGERFGFAVVPQGGALVTDTVAVDDRVAEAIRDSEGDPAGACGAGGAKCDATVVDAAFNDAWKIFANTLEGSPVTVHVAPTVGVTYAAVTARGSTWVETSPASGAAPPHFQSLGDPLAYQLTTTAAYAGPVETCVGYDAQLYAGYGPRLFRLGANGWNDVTTSAGMSTVCALTDGLGTFAIFAADPTPPEVVPHVEGPQGNAGWYVGDVTVTWTVTDAQSPSSIVTSGCGETSITTDTPGTTLTCTATSNGGTASSSVTVKRDATVPGIACLPTPASLWPPTGKLVPVTVAVTVTDATSGPDSFLLTHTTASDGDPNRGIVEFQIGTADVAGLLRATRPGTAEERVYTLTYTAHDLAGNGAECAATIVVPHDQGNDPGAEPRAAAISVGRARREPPAE
jgi:hypothetical protein